MINKHLVAATALLLAVGTSPAQQSADVQVETKVIERSNVNRLQREARREYEHDLAEQSAALAKQHAEFDQQRDIFEEFHGEGGPEGWPIAPGFPRSGGSRALLLADQPPTDEARGAAQEDAGIMLRLLERAVRDDRRDDPMQAMGIHIEALGGRSGPQTIYLGGFGAVFLLNADYPLVAPPASDQEAKPKAEGESEWERTRRELYGRPGRPPRPPGPEGQPFDPNRVERLKNALIDALANATNLRQVAGGESVVVSVTGPSNQAGGTVHFYSNDGGADGTTVERRVENLRNRERELTGQYTDEHQSVKKVRAEIAVATSDLDTEKTIARSKPHTTQLTLKALKSDIDAFATKSLNREEFAKQVKVVAY